MKFMDVRQRICLICAVSSTQKILTTVFIFMNRVYIQYFVFIFIVSPFSIYWNIQKCFFAYNLKKNGSDDFYSLQGARIWIPNAITVWEGAELCDNYNDGDKKLHIITDAGQERVIEIRNDNDLPLLRNPSILIGQNDLTALSYLHEPDVLHTLEVRYV